MKSYLISLKPWFSVWGVHCPLAGIWEPAGHHYDSAGRSGIWD